MAISGFGRGDRTDAGGGSSAPAPVAAAGNLSAFIDQGSEFEGKLTFKDTVRIDGRFTGEISSENTLIVGESGHIEATIHSTNVVVSGAVVGDIHATNQIVLHKTAQIEGNLDAPSLVIEEGASFNGRVSMGGKSSASLKAISGGNKDHAGKSGGTGGGDVKANG